VKVVIPAIILVLVVSAGVYFVLPKIYGAVAIQGSNMDSKPVPASPMASAPDTRPAWPDPVPGSVFRLSAADQTGEVTAHDAEPTADRFGRPGRAYSFNGQSSFVQINKPLGLTPDAMTISIWVRYNQGNYSNSWDRAIITQDGGDDDGGTRRYFQLSTMGQKITCHRFNTSKDLFSLDTIKPEHWCNAVLTYDGQKFNLYIDGELNDSQTGTLRASDTEPIFVGKKGTDAANFYFDGQIGDIRIYKKALTAAEVSAIYHEGGWPNPAAANPPAGTTKSN
jgi:hypothetical protein